jgi:hypothetical protein
MYGEIGGLAREQGQQNEVARLSQVQKEMERAATISEHLLKAVGELRARLSPLLRSTPEGKGEQSSKPTLVGHAMALSNHNDQISSALCALTDILERLEL